MSESIYKHMNVEVPLSFLEKLYLKYTCNNRHNESYFIGICEQRVSINEGAWKRNEK